MQQIGIGAAAQSELRRREILAAFPQLAAKAEIGVRISSERYVLERIPEIRTALRIAEIGVTLVIAQGFVGGCLAICQRGRWGHDCSQQRESGDYSEMEHVCAPRRRE